MTISDIALIVIIAGVAIIGFIKGMKKGVGAFLKFGLSVLGAFFLTKLLADLLLDVDFIARYIAGNNSLFAFIRSLLPGGLDLVSTSSIKANVDGYTSAQAMEKVRALLVSNGMGGFFMDFGFVLFGHALINPAYLNSSLPTATDIVALELSYAFLCVIIFIMLFLAFRLLLALFSKLFKQRGKTKKKFLLRLGALIIGGAKGFCYTLLLLCLVSVMSLFSFMSIINEDIDKSDVARPLLKTSAMLVSNAIESPQDDPRYQKLIDIAGYGVAAPVEQ